MSIEYWLLVIEAAAGGQVLGLAFAGETDFPRMRPRYPENSLVIRCK